MRAAVGVLAVVFFAGVAIAETPAWVSKLNDAGLELHGFVDYTYGQRLSSDPVEDTRTLDEIRLQLDTIWYSDYLTAQVKGDFLYNDLAQNRNHIDLSTGRGFFDLRQANVLFSPLSWMDIKAGRQVLTWGTGDLVFINDLFPKDWQSFFLGRDVEYLKAPSDALFVSMFPGVVSVDIAYMPCFDADRYITGEYLSYWNGRSLVGQDSIVNTDDRNEWFRDDEISARVYRNVGAYEAAIYGYSGYWKSPAGMDPATGDALFPELAVYGASVRGPMASGIANLEAGYYDSAEDRSGKDPFISNSESRLLVGYEKEVVRDFTVGVQYYLEHMLDYKNFKQALKDISMYDETARDEDRHTLTLRLTWLLMNQNLILSCFTRWSPSDNDVYIKPVATYKISDRWQASVGADLFAGEHEYTFLGQFENNSNIHGAVRCSF